MGYPQTVWKKHRVRFHYTPPILLQIAGGQSNISLDPTYRMRGAESCKVTWLSFCRVTKKFSKLEACAEMRNGLHCEAQTRLGEVPVQMCPTDLIPDNSAGVFAQYVRSKPGKC